MDKEDVKACELQFREEPREKIWDLAWRLVYEVSGDSVPSEAEAERFIAAIEKRRDVSQCDSIIDIFKEHILELSPKTPLKGLGGAKPPLPMNAKM
jgi:hypothetical protein